MLRRAYGTGSLCTAWQSMFRSKGMQGTFNGVNFSHRKHACLPLPPTLARAPRQRQTDVLTGNCGDAGSANPTNTSCFTCYTGAMCTEKIPDCLVVETCGWPLIMSEIWSGRHTTTTRPQHNHHTTNTRPTHNQHTTNTQPTHTGTTAPQHHSTTAPQP